ncbi:hypothetical protein M501DRAFT_984867 [Patellaria atrata CBS 101060]|uniref:Uncharacterized protein n=1 Tax=Patellaria atrata CBS 101060 TaxID=1346257 RepID=A0A9P4SHM7_9PEZI|nr:hypothetical protein M501DRAFT_984867 [Patellaria atrata CBS 101060]
MSIARTTLQKLTFICAISSTVPSSLALTTALHTARTVGLLRPREPSQICGGNSQLRTCGASLPDDFCCPAASSCLQLNTTGINTDLADDIISIICCPAGAKCSFIAPITCDIQAQNATLHPANQIHTSNLDVGLPTCGEGCCPLGYSCADGRCQMNRSDGPRTSTSSVLEVFPAPTSTSSSSPQSDVPIASPVGSSGISPGGAAGIAIGCLFAGGLIMLGVVCLISRRREKKNRTSHSSNGSHMRNISKPISNPALNTGTDMFPHNSIRYAATHSPATMRDYGLPIMSEHSTNGLNMGFGAESEPRPSYQADTADISPVTPPQRVEPLFSTATSTTSAPPPRFVSNLPNPFSSPTRTTASPRQNPYSTPERRNNAPLNPYAESTAGSRVSSDSFDRRQGSSETVHVMLPAQAYLQPPPPLAVPGQSRDKASSRMTGDTTFTRFIEGGKGNGSVDGKVKKAKGLGVTGGDFMSGARAF